MKAVLLAATGAVIAVLAFPPYGPGVLVVMGVALFLTSIRFTETGRQGLVVGWVYGLVFFGWLMWWLTELEIIALILVPVQAAFFAAYGWWLARHDKRSPGVWLVLAVGGWAFMEIIRYHFPVGGLEWGAVGYALSDGRITRLPASVVGTVGLTVLTVLLAGMIAQIISRRAGWGTLWGAIVFLVALGGSYTWVAFQTVDDQTAGATVVQGSTPCPFQHCPPNERLRTYEQHLALTQTLEQAELVVWPEGSTGSTNADPVLNDDVRESIAVEATRLDARFVIGGDRIISDTEWINANVYFDRDGRIVGEYRKQHPVPFGEYIPLRPLFEWIPALDRVPRDMIRGDGPVLFDGLGSIISFEGGFSRYALGTRRAGATVIIVNTNEASYGPDAPTSDQFIGMTRMRAVELGVPVIHAAVTGKSTIVDIDGELGEATGIGTMEALEATYRESPLTTPYTRIGDSVLYLSAMLAVLTWWRIRSLVGSEISANEEE